jgi:hypothetical protein
MIELYLLVNTNIGVINISACMKPNAREWTFPFFDDVYLQFQSSNEKVTRQVVYKKWDKYLKKKNMKDMLLFER